MQGFRFGLLVSCVLVMGVPVAHAKFLQTDPVGYQDQMNLYAYVHNDPINNTDPTGMQTAQELRYNQAVRQWSSGELTDKELWALSNGPCGGTCNDTEVVLTATTMLTITGGGVGCLAGGCEAIAAFGPALGVAAEISNLSSGDHMPSVGKMSPAPNPKQAANLARFEKKLPSGNTGTHVDELGDGVIATAEVPGKVPGSKAVYQKAIGPDGQTNAYVKTTMDSYGNVVHVKDKLTEK